MNLGKVILIGSVKRLPETLINNDSIYTFEVGVEEERDFKSSFNIQCSGDYFLSIKDRILLDDLVYIEGTIRGQALKRRRLKNQSLTIIFARSIKLLNP